LVVVDIGEELKCGGVSGTGLGVGVEHLLDEIDHLVAITMGEYLELLLNNLMF
jgi:hypothetical protein